MKRFFTVLVLFISFLGFSQKVKLKKEEVLVDKVLWLKYKEENSFDYSIINLKGDEIIYIKYVKRGPSSMVFSKEGKPNYYVISFLGLNKKIEIRNFVEDIMTTIYNSKVVNEDGMLNEGKVNILVEKIGTQFSNENNANSNQTIIIKEEPSRGSGVNINIAR